MVVGNTLCKRTVVAYFIFFFTALLIWIYHEKSIRLEEEEDALKTRFPTSLTIKKIPTTTMAAVTVTTTTAVKKVLHEDSPKRIEVDRLTYWLQNNTKTIGVNLSAILATKRPGKYLVYVCHENCGGKTEKGMD